MDSVHAIGLGIVRAEQGFALELPGLASSADAQYSKHLSTTHRNRGTPTDGTDEAPRWH